MSNSKNPPGDSTRRQTQFYKVLTHAAETLQRVDTADRVFDVIGEQIVALGLHGALVLLDASGENLVLRALAQPGRTLRIIERIAAKLGTHALGFTFPVTQVKVFHQIIQTGHAHWASRSWRNISALIPPIVLPLAQSIAKTYADQPGIYAPVIIQGRPQGILLVSGKHLIKSNLDWIQAFANHIAVALENTRLYSSLRSSEEHFRAFIEHGSDLFFLLDQTGIIQYASPSAGRLLGYASEQVVGKSVFDFIHPDDWAHTRSAFAHRLVNPGPADSTLIARVRHADGTWRILEVMGNNLFDNSTLNGMLLTGRDVTDRTLAEQSSRTYEAQLRAAFDNLPLDFWACDREGRYVAQNASSLKNWGDMRGKLPHELGLPLDIAGQWQANDQRALAGQVLTNEVEYIRDGAPRTFLEIISPIRQDDEIQGILGVNMDITARKQTENDLRARERHLALLNEITRAAIETPDIQTMTQTLADRLGELLGADECYITGWDANRQRTYGIAASGHLRDRYATQSIDNNERTMTASVLEAEHALVADDVLNSPHIAPHIAAQFSARSLLGLPLIAAGKKLGAALIGFAQPHHFTEDEISRGEQAARQIALAIAQAQLLAETQARAAELETIRQATISLTSSLDLKSVLAFILDGVLRLAQDANDTHIFLFANDKLSFGAARFANDLRETPWAEPRQDGITYTVARQGQPIIIPNTKTHPLYAGTSADWGGSIISLPLKISERVVGVMNVAYWQPRNFDETFVRSLQLLGDQAALAIENARLYEAERARATELEVLRQTTIKLTSSRDLPSVFDSLLEGVFHLIGDLKDSNIFLYRDGVLTFGAAREPQGPRYVPYAQPRQNGLTYTVARSGQVYVVPDMTQDPVFADAPYEWRGAMISVPLKIGDQVVGVLNLAFTDPRTFNASELQTIRLLGDQAALAIENARLFQAERAARDQSETLRQAAQAVSTSLNLPHLLHTIMEQLKHVIPNDTASVLLFDENGEPELTAGIGYADEFTTTRATKNLLKDSRILSQMATNHRAVNLPDVRQNADWIWVVGAEQVIAWLAVPILAQDRLIGVLMMDRNTPNAFSAAEEQLTQTFAQHLAVPLENAHLFEQTQQRAREFGALHETAQELGAQTEISSLLYTIIRRVTQTINTQDGVIYLYDAATNELVTAANCGLQFPLRTRWQVSEGASGVVVRTRQPILIDDYRTWEHRRLSYDQSNLTAVAQVPIIYSGELIGILGVAEIAPSTRKFTDDDIRLLSLFASQAASAVHNARLLTETKQRAEQLAALTEITRDLGVHYAAPALLQTILERAVTLLGTSSASMHLYDPVRNDLEFTLCTTPNLNLGSRRQMNEGWVGRVAVTRQPIIVNDYATQTDRLPHFDHLKISALMLVPIVYGGELIGVLTAYDNQPSTRRFTQTDLDLLSLFAGHAASAIHNAHLLAETKQRAEQLEWLYNAGLALNRVLDPGAQLHALLDSAMKALRAERARFGRWDPINQQDCFELGIGYPADLQEKLRGMRYASDETRSLSGWVLHHHQPLNLPDVNADPRYQPIDSAIRSGLWVPIEHEGEPRGTLAVLSTRPNAFNEQDEKLLTLFANQVSVAMENARLFRQTRQRLAELEAVNRISTALRTTPTIENMVPLFLREATEALEAVHTSLWLYDPARDVLFQSGLHGDNPPAEHVVKPGEGVVGHVFTSGKIYRSQDFRTDPRTLDWTREYLVPGRNGACVPVCAGLQPIGVMFATVDTPNQFSDDQAQLLVTLAEIVGNAIHRMRLYEQTTRRANELAIVNKLGHTLGETRDLPAIYQRTAAAAELVLPGITTVLVSLYDAAIEQVTCVYGTQRGTPIDVNLLPVIPLESPDHDAQSQAIIEHHPLIVNGPSSGLRRTSFVLDETINPPESVIHVPLLARDSVVGIIQVHSDTPNHFTTADAELLELIAHPATSAIENARLFADLQHAYDETIEGWARALDLRDRETEGHTRRVVDRTLALARAMGMPEEMMPHLRRGALLHDIGKVGIPDAILLKPGPLTANEWETMRMHPAYAYALLSSIEYLREALDIPYCHHERWNGTGYPRSLAGDAIPLAARIFSIVDVWDALCSNRPYRAAWPRDKALTYLQEQAGEQFDPHVVHMFIELEKKRGDSSLLS